MRAELIDGLCQRYSCLPSALLREPAHLLLPMLGLLFPDKGTEGKLPENGEVGNMEESLAGLSLGLDGKPMVRD